MIIHYILGELLPLVFFVCTGTFVGVSAGRSYGRRRDRRARALAEARADEYSHSFLKDDGPEEKLRKLREYRRSRSRAQYGITPRSIDS